MFFECHFSKEEYLGLYQISTMKLFSENSYGLSPIFAEKIHRRYLVES